MVYIFPIFWHQSGGGYMSDILDEYYNILNLDRDASRDDIRSAYRRLALRYHPDKNPGNEEASARAFIEINEAYSILVDSEHTGRSFDDIDDAMDYFRKNFYDLARRIDSEDLNYDAICQEECDFFFKYQLEEVSCVRRSIIEARRIINLLRKACMKGYDNSEILENYSDFFQKYGFNGDMNYNGYDDLIAEYRRLAEEDPDNPNAHYNLGLVYEKRGMIDAAISEYKLALYLDPKNMRTRKALEKLERRFYS